GPGIGALQVIADQLFDLSLNDRPLESVFRRADLLLQELPVDAAGRLFLALAAAAGRLIARTEGENLEAHERLEVGSREESLVEPHAKLIEPERGNGEHPDPSLNLGGIIWDGVQLSAVSYQLSAPDRFP